MGGAYFKTGGRDRELKDRKVENPQPLYQSQPLQTTVPQAQRLGKVAHTPGVLVESLQIHGRFSLRMALVASREQLPTRFGKTRLPSELPNLSDRILPVAISSSASRLEPSKQSKTRVRRE